MYSNSAGSKTANHGMVSSFHLLPMYHKHSPAPLLGEMLAADRNIPFSPMVRDLGEKCNWGSPRLTVLAMCTLAQQGQQHRHVHVHGTFAMSTFDL